MERKTPLLRPPRAAISPASASMSDAVTHRCVNPPRQGAARGAAVGAKHFTLAEAFEGLEREATIEPDPARRSEYEDAYGRWSTEVRERMQ